MELSKVTLIALTSLDLRQKLIEWIDLHSPIAITWEEGNGSIGGEVEIFLEATETTFTYKYASSTNMAVQVIKINNQFHLSFNYYADSKVLIMELNAYCSKPCKAGGHVLFYDEKLYAYTKVLTVNATNLSTYRAARIFNQNNTETYGNSNCVRVLNKVAGNKQIFMPYLTNNLEELQDIYVSIQEDANFLYSPLPVQTEEGYFLPISIDEDDLSFLYYKIPNT